MIRIKNVHYAIGEKTILKDITLAVPKGGLTALIGPNGAGKSSLLSLIARIEPLQTGIIHVDDLQIGACSDRELARLLSILPQTPDQPPRLTVRELVGFGRYPYHRGRPTSEDTAKVDEALDVLAIALLADRPLDTLSGGQRQRALIAMIFAQDTDYLLLDEPLNNLDLAGSRMLMKILRMLVTQHNKTVVLVVHDINVAMNHADHVVAMKSGAVVRTGPPAEVIDQRLINEAFNTDAPIVVASGQRWVAV